MMFIHIFQWRGRRFLAWPTHYLGQSLPKGSFVTQESPDGRR